MIDNLSLSQKSQYLVYHQRTNRLPRRPAKFVVSIIIYLTACGIHRVTAASSFVRSRSGSSTAHDNRQVQQRQHQQQLNPLKLYKSVSKYRTISTTTTAVNQVRRTTTTTNRLFPYAQHMTHYYPQNSFMTTGTTGHTATHRTVTSSTSMSSTAAATAIVAGAGAGGKIFDTTGIIAGLSRTSATSIAVASTLLISAFCGLLVELVVQRQEPNSGKDWKLYLPPSILVTLTASTTMVYIRYVE
jgi:hypothetical protein